MIHDFRTNTTKLHAPEKRAFAATLGALAHLSKLDSREWVAKLLIDLKTLCKEYGIAGDEHLKRPEKAELAAGKAPAAKKELLPDAT